MPAPRTRRDRATLTARVVAVLLLAALLALDIVAVVTGRWDYDAGGDCGGRGCINSSVDKGMRYGIAIVVLMIAIAWWPRLVRRYRANWVDV